MPGTWARRRRGRPAFSARPRGQGTVFASGGATPGRPSGLPGPRVPAFRGPTAHHRAVESATGRCAPCAAAHEDEAPRRRLDRKARELRNCDTGVQESNIARRSLRVRTRGGARACDVFLGRHLIIAMASSGSPRSSRRPSGARRAAQCRVSRMRCAARGVARRGPDTRQRLRTPEGSSSAPRGTPETCEVPAIGLQRVGGEALLRRGSQEERSGGPGTRLHGSAEGLTSGFTKPATRRRAEQLPTPGWSQDGPDLGIRQHVVRFAARRMAPRSIPASGVPSAGDDVGLARHQAHLDDLLEAEHACRDPGMERSASQSSPLARARWRRHGRRAGRKARPTTG